MPEVHFHGGREGGSGVKDMAHPHFGNLGAKFSPKFPQLRPVLRKLGVVIFRQLFKTFNSNNFTLSSMFSFQNM